jgi:Carboxyl transferase domain/Malonate decarboxylase gamma subunit (MdcE)
MNHIQTLSDLKSRVEFSALGELAGNITLGRGRLHGQPVHVALIENRIASGSLGVKECEKLASLFRIVAVQKTPLLLYIDSAGARVSEGLPALGAFRRLMRAALEAAFSGAPFVALLGANCYGGASMLAALARVRVFADNTQLAMSGPSILAQAAGSSALDEAFRAIAEASIGASARKKLDASNAGTWDGSMPPPDTNATESAFHAHQQRRARLTLNAKRIDDELAQPVQRKDLAALFPGGVDAWEVAGEGEGVLFGKVNENQAALLGLVDRKPVTALRAWALADRVWALARAAEAPRQLAIVVDCEAHSTSIEDEKVMLSAYIAGVAVALTALAKRGTYIETTVLGVLGGGIYVALAATSVNVNLLHGAHIQLLPGRAIQSILGSSDETAPNELGDYQKAGVAEKELRVGYLRDMK